MREGLLGPGATWHGVGGVLLFREKQPYLPFLRPHVKADVGLWALRDASGGLGGGRGVISGPP